MASIDEKSSARLSSEADAKFEKHTMRCVDLRIITVLGLVASFSVIDRVNTGYAYASGMGVDLALNKGPRLSLVICLYFIPHILLQLPSNLFLRKLNVRNWLTFTVISWGAVQLGMGFVRNWHELIVCRVLLGVFEATLTPSLNLIITTWYKRHEVQLRFGAIMVLEMLAGGTGPLLAYSFTLLNGKSNLAGWRWIFIIEGVVTILLGLVVWFFIPDFPDKNKFLTAKQTAVVLRRIEEDRKDAVPDIVTFEKVKKHLSDWTLWSCSILFLCCGLPAIAQGFFLPIIVSQMGWPGTQALLLSSAPCVTAFVALLVAYIADKYKHRTMFIALSAMICMAGISLLAFAGSKSVRYSGAFLIGAGAAGGIPTILAFSSNNVVSQSKRSVQIAMLGVAGDIGGLIGTVAFRSQDAPRYIPGLVTSLVSQGVLLLVLFVTTGYYFRQNNLARKGGLIEGQTGFLYTL